MWCSVDLCRVEQVRTEHIAAAKEKKRKGARVINVPVPGPRAREKNGHSIIIIWMGKVVKFLFSLFPVGMSRALFII